MNAGYVTRSIGPRFTWLVDFSTLEGVALLSPSLICCLTVLYLNANFLGIVMFECQHLELLKELMVIV